MQFFELNNVSLFFKKDMECLETYQRDFLLKYNYQLQTDGLKYPFLKYFPLKAELKVWKDTVTSFNIKKIFSIPIFWYKRIKLMNKKIYNNINFPNSIGSSQIKK